VFRFSSVDRTELANRKIQKSEVIVICNQRVNSEFSKKDEISHVLIGVKDVPDGRIVVSLM
jgi:hypothetical protein